MYVVRCLLLNVTGPSGRDATLYFTCEGMTSCDLITVGGLRISVTKDCTRSRCIWVISPGDRGYRSIPYINYDNFDEWDERGAEMVCIYPLSRSVMVQSSE
jgi:hypothetical protein